MVAILAPLLRRPSRPTHRTGLGSTFPFAVMLLVLPAAPHRPNGPFCSKIALPYARSAAEIYFLATALPDTLLAGAGTVGPGTEEGHFGTGTARPVYGQRVRVERVGRAWAARLPAGQEGLVLVPWDFDAACRPVFWSGSARWVQPGTRGLFRAVLRDRRDWSQGLPTLDVFDPDASPYPSATAVRRDLSFARRGGAAALPLLTAEELLDLMSRLPTYDSLEAEPDAAVAPLRAWARAHPALARSWPASDVLHFVRYSATLARVRQISSPMAGTFRVTVLFGTGDSTVMYARADPHPRSAIYERGREDVRGPREHPIGYYLTTRYEASPSDLDAAGGDGVALYHAAALTPSLVTKDSSVWRGEVDPLVAVTFLDVRAAVRQHAHSLFGTSERVRDPDWYFLPGIWVSYPSGRLRYEWTARSGTTLLYAVRAERIATVGAADTRR